MPSHACPELGRRVHFIFRSSQQQPMELLRDFKRYTSNKMIKIIQDNVQESRKEWLLWMFEKAGKEKGNIHRYQFWQHHNKPIELWTVNVIQQKNNYIHNNPVASGFVVHAIDWKYSSARNFQDDATVLEIDETGFLELD